MSINPKPDAPAPIPPDVFDMERLATGHAAPAAPSMDAPPVSVLSRALQAAKPLHFGLLSAAAAIAWIGWPHVFPGEASPERPGSRLMLPTTAESLPPATQPGIPPNAPSPEATQRQAEPSAPEEPTFAPPALPPFAHAMPPPPPTPPARARARQSSHRVRTITGHSQPAIPTTGAASKNFSLNTVYAGQAWIQDDERIYVVQAGDTVQGIAIISIDARERRVVTSQGVIR